MLEAADSNKKLMLARIEGEEENLEVIGSATSKPYERSPSKPLLLMRVPNLKYDHLEVSAQNFSPGTSLIFNAYRGHSGLLTQPYMSAAEDPNSFPHDRMYRRVEGPHPQDVQLKHHSHQRLTYHTQGDGVRSSYSPYEQVQRSPYHSPRQRQPQPTHTGDLVRDPNDHRNHHNYQDYRDSSDTWKHGDPRDYERSSGASSFAAIARMSPRMEHSHDSQGRTPGYHDPRSHQDEYSQQPMSRPPPRQQISSDGGSNIPSLYLPTNRPAHWKYSDSDSSYVHSSQESSNQYRPHAPPLPQPRSSIEQWEMPSDSKPSRPTAAIDIPRPRNHGPANYPDNFDLHDPTNTTKHGQAYQHPHPHSTLHGAPGSGVAGSGGSRGPLHQKAIGPRYALSRVNYRMIFEYASEIRECFIKGRVGTTDRLLYNTEILSKIFMGCRVDIDPNAPVEEKAQTVNPHQLRCTSCNIVKTPEWRKGPLGPRTLCNACGLIWGKMSRSKAALAKNKLQTGPKQESSASNTTESNTDTHMTDAATKGQDNIKMETSSPLGGSRKRGHDLDSASEADDVENTTREEENRPPEESLQEAQQQRSDMTGHSSGSLQQTSTMDHGSGPDRPSGHGDQEKQQTLVADDQQDHAEDVSAGGRKLALSYLLG
ncbi:blue light receptor [Mortierella claussenii]|nr:blue light receptor [Mortierella claussenii]